MAERHDDIRWMRLAIALGARRLGQTWPNPAVGCVIVKDGKVIARGETQPGGRPHAEAMALKRAGDRAASSAAYVSLEPCAHHGETAPCAQALVEAGVSRVVYAMEDPDPRVSGKGHALLGQGGVEVVANCLRAEALQIHRGFLSRIQRGRPSVTLKTACSLDGRIATSSGESKWITGPAARRHAHSVRMRHDAIMTGSGTAGSDNPNLTVRGLGQVRQPVRILVDSGLKTDEGGNLGRAANSSPVWCLHSSAAAGDRIAAWEKTGAKLIRCEKAEGKGVDMGDAMSRLAGHGITRILCESGGNLAASLLASGLVDEIIAYTAGRVIGADGIPAVSDMGLRLLSEAPEFKLLVFDQLGGDAMHHWVCE